MGRTARASSRSIERHRETTLVVELERVVEAALHLRDEEGFNFLSDMTAVDYLGWGGKDVSGYIGTPAGRDLNAPMTQGYQAVPLGEAEAASRSTTTCSRSRSVPAACGCRRGSTTASRCRP